MQKTHIILMFFIFLPEGLFAQEPFKYTFDISITNRVDTTHNSEVKQVFHLWKNYLLSRPDSVYNNPYWNTKEKERFKNFDLSRTSIYQFSAPELLSYYKPTVLAIEKEGNKYSIRTLFYAEGLKGEYKGSNTWGILKIFALKENNEWKLENNFFNETKNWHFKNYGYIQYHYAHSHKFDSLLAFKSIQFCDSIAKVFDFPKTLPFDFYVTKSPDELGLLLGLEYVFAGIAYGKALYDERILLGGFDSEYYPHEFVHFITPNNKNRNDLIEEGFATWLGGSQNKSFTENIDVLAKELFKSDTISLNHILNKNWGWSYNSFYTSGALICQMVFEKRGVKGIKQLLNADTKTDDKMFNELKKLLAYSKEQFIKAWKERLKKYLK
jgi:hypothetical protein